MRIVFDLDGTLIDSAPDIEGVANGLLAPHGAALSDAQTRDFIGNGVEVFVTRMLAACGLDAGLHGEMVAGFKSAYLTAVERTHPYAGVAQALKDLRAQGHALGICTNKPLAPCRAVLDHLGLSVHFATVWGGDSLAVRKPDPAPLRAALEALGEGPCLFVGDSEVDAQTAVAAGVPFALFTEGYRKSPVHEIPHRAAFSDFAELPARVRKFPEWP